MPGEDAVFIEFDAPNSQATALDPQEDAIMTLDHSTREEPRAVRLTKALVWPLTVLHILSAVLATMSIQSMGDRKSTRLNSSHVAISYAVFCSTTSTCT